MRLYGIVDDAAGYISSLVGRVTDWVGSKATEGVRDFRAKLKSFQARYTYLQNNPPPYVVSPEIMDQYQGLLNDARNIASRAATVEKGIVAIEKTLNTTLGGFGVLPAAVIPAAVVAGIVGVVYLINQFMSRSDAFIREKLGMKPPPRDPGLFGEAASLVWPLAITGAAFLLYKDSKR